MTWLADAEASRIVRELGTARHRLALLIVEVLHVGLVREVLAVGDGEQW